MLPSKSEPRRICSFASVIGLLVLVLARNLALGADAPDPAEFDRVPAEAKSDMIGRWSRLLAASREKGTEAAKSDWKPGPEWQPVLDRLSKITPEQRALIGPALYFFENVGLPSPECLKLCHTVIESTGPDLNAEKQQALNVLARVGATDEKSITLIVAELKQQKSPQSALLKNICNNSVVKSLIRDWLKSGTVEQRSVAMSALSKSKPSQEDLSIATTVALDCLEHAELPGNAETAQEFLFYRQTAPFDFTEKLSPQQLKRCQELLLSPNRTVKVGAILLLLQQSESSVQELKTIFNAVDPDPLNKTSDVLAAIGFLPKFKMDPQDLESVLSFAKQRSQVIRSTVWSLFLRCGGDLGRVKGLLTSITDLPDPEYWLAFSGACPFGVMPPAAWSKIRPEHASVLFDSLRKMPLSPEAGPAIAKFIADKNVDRPRLLQTLWQLRRNPALKDIPELRNWLIPSAADSDFGKLCSASVLAKVFNDMTSFNTIVDKLIQNSNAELAYWSPTTNLILEVKPDSKALDIVRANIIQTPDPGTKWLCWLLDLRRGVKVDRAPIDSMASALKSEKADIWLSALNDGSDLLKPHIAEFRSPSVFFASSTDSPRLIMRLLGILDRVELNQ